jgi:hypothetical protein
MGVVLLSCIIPNAITRGRGTFCYFLVETSCRRPVSHRSSVVSASAVFSSITTGGPHEFLGHSGIRRLQPAETVSCMPSEV